MPRESDGLRLKLFLIKQLEELLKQLSGEDGGRIADVNFAYYNSWLLDGLRDRGDAIKYQQWDKLNELNKKLTQEIHDKMDKLITPKCAFVSIESETYYNYLSDVETVNEATGQMEKGKITLAGKRSKVQEAPEPTNVIWENRDFQKEARVLKLLLVIVAVCVVLFLTFMVTVYAKNTTNELVGKYDDSLNCNELKNMYDAKTESSLAADEWVDFYKNGGEEQGRQIAPVLSCFCTAQYME